MHSADRDAQAVITVNAVLEYPESALSLIGAEYFIDTDPGAGNGTALSVTLQDGKALVEREIILPSLSEGMYILYVRFRDTQYGWGPARGTRFLVTSQMPSFTLAGAEYFIDTDPGKGAGTSIAAPLDGTFDEAEEELSADISVTGLTEGLHRAFVRTKDSRGYWGPARGTYFLVSAAAQPVIVDAEYFFDTDPGQGKGTHLPAKDGSYNSTAESGEITVPVSSTGLGVGNHKAYIRFKNSRGDWSSYKYADFSIVVKPVIEISTTSIAFGTVFIGDSAKEEFVIRNAGDANLIISSITAPTGFKTSFTSAQGTILPGDSLKVQVTFKPTAETNYSGNIVISNNDTQKVIAVSGRGSAVPVSKITITPTAPLNFGNVDIFTEVSKSVQVKITNTGTKKLWISSITSSNPQIFSHDFTSLTDSIAINGYITFHAIFTPKDTLEYPGYFTIANNSPTPNYQYDLRGKGVGTFAPRIVVLKDTLDFGNVPVTTAKDLFITIENDGTDTLKITGFQKSADIAGVIAITPTTYNILPNNSKNFKVTFTPVNPVQYRGEIVILNDDQPDTVTVVGVGVDNIPPTITYDPTTLANTPVKLNTAINISASVTDNNVVQWVKLYYRKAGFATYDSLTMTKNGGNYYGTIPAARVTERGVEYYLRAFDGANYQLIPTTAPAVPAIVRVIIPSLPPKTTLVEKYEMFSVPSDLNKKKVNDLLEAAIGPYDINLYRVFRWVNGAYVELKDNPNFTFDPGKAYWLITATQKVINLDTSISVRTDQDFELSLYQGWNQVGTPFYFPVDWDDVIGASGSGVIQGQVAFEWDGTGWVHASVLDPFKGYFIYTPSGGNNLKVPAREASTHRKPVVMRQVEPGEWLINLQAYSDNLADRANYFGMRQNAADEWDVFDIPDPPSIGNNWVNVYFNRQSWSQFPGNYSGDFKAVNSSGSCYDFTVIAAGCKAQVALKFAPETTLPDNFATYLLDPERRVQEKIDLHSELILTSTNGKLHRNYRLIVGTEQFYREHNLGIGPTPQSFALSQNYPNPFNPRTVLSYQIPEPCQVTLAIYNVLGQRVRTLVSEEFKYPGYYQVVWNGETDDGKALASGVYWYTLHAGKFQQTKKMLFIK